MKLKLIYVAGPYRAKTTLGVADNIRAAERVGIMVANAGAMPIIPHANTGLVFTDVADDTFWLEATLELMRRCDGVVMLANWRESTGARGEYEEAVRIGLPILDLSAGASIATWLISIEPRALVSDEFRFAGIVK